MGNAFALLQIKAILAILLRRFEFELVSDPRRRPTSTVWWSGPRSPAACATGGARRPRQARSAGERRTAEATHAQPGGPTAGRCPLTGAEAPAPASVPSEARAAPAAVEHKRYRVSLDLDLCQSHGVCASEAPEVFRVDGLGKSQLLNPTPPASLSTKVEAAARYCPTRAIRIEEA